MNLQFSPMRRDDSLVLERQGDILIINGEAFDFSPLEEGQTLPGDAVNSPWITGPVSRHEGQLVLTVLLPHGPDASPEQLSPTSLEVTSDGLVTLPGSPVSEF